MKITTNNQPRELVSFYDLPEYTRQELDYITEDDRFDYRLFKYRGHWYDAFEFQTAPDRVNQMNYYLVWTVPLDDIENITETRLYKFDNMAQRQRFEYLFGGTSITAESARILMCVCGEGWNIHAHYRVGVFRSMLLLTEVKTLNV